jgi:4-alpha-glucanotransferase
MLIHFQIEYHTRWGEQIILLLHLQNKTVNIDMSNDGCGIWFKNLNLDDITKKTLISYSYVLQTDGKITRKENCNHFFPNINTDNIVIFDRWIDNSDTVTSPIIIPCVRINDNPLWKGAGTSIPVFSLKSEDDFGIGEFSDLKKFVDWAVKSGQSVIQILPVNDTTLTKTWKDSYPYSANSSFALNPIYINLRTIGKLKEQAEEEFFEKRRLELNSLPQIDYEKVLYLKTQYLDFLYAEYGKIHLQTTEFKDFFIANKSWLEPYAVYCFLRDKYNTPEFSRWKESIYTTDILDYYCSPENPSYNEIRKYMFVQFHLYKQLSDVKTYANQRGILLKGDVPIGLNRNSVDVWIHPELFHTDCQAGAPPDDFARDGQKWGLPTYNWVNMAKDGYSWFIERFKTMSNYFNAYRIDHLLGFFRIWEIPLQYNSGLMGRFNPALPYSKYEIEEFGFHFIESRHTKPEIGKAETDVLFLKDSYSDNRFHPRILGYETDMFKNLNKDDRNAYLKLHEDYFYRHNENFWYDNAMSKLPVLISSTDMLACGEDLGMIPSCVPIVMDKLRILGLEVQRMPKALGSVIGNPTTYPYMSVCTTSTHDMSVLREWLQNEMPSNAILTAHSGDSDNCKKVIESHLASNSMLAIFPLQDWLSIDDNLKAIDPTKERINIPSDSENYWRYRMHLTLEELLCADKFNNTISKLLRAFGR